ncbi:PucR family transcriptional regulator [Effusibacillus pohliae]|uniref:PucR family transcriptional regulator n=1 Tax=Effusibacillus pohliae TaxID=232270 RepID=UPI00035CC3FF|nr:PucR family transcriptional regulator [Effusibacillus pohliae]
MHKEWVLTVADVLKRPLFQHAEVVAGSRGLSRPIRWVHILETAESGSFLNGGELVLATGVGVGESREKRLAYLHELIRRKAVGLCIELGPYIPEIPLEMLELADHHEFPLIAFRKPVRFVDITLDLHENIINRHTEALRELESFSRSLQRLTLQAKSLPKILSHFQAAVDAQTFFLPVDGSPLFAPAMGQMVQSELTRLLQHSLLSRPELPQTAELLPVSERKRILCQPIMAMGQVLACLGVVLYEREPDEFLYLTLDYTATAIAQILLRKMFAQEREFDNQTQLLDDLLHGRIRDEEQIRTLLGVQPGTGESPAYFAAIMEIALERPPYEDETDSPLHDLLGVFRSILQRSKWRPLLRSQGNRLYLLLTGTGPSPAGKIECKQAMADLEQVCRRALGRQIAVRFGVSRLSRQYARADRHFREAEQALARPAQIESPFFDDLGVYRLLMQFTERYPLDSFVEDCLGPILRYDAEHGTQLTWTLRVFLDHNCSKQETAERLYIRRQTLYHRLEKIRELLGDSYLSAEHRLSLELALRAHDWLQTRTGRKGTSSDAPFFDQQAESSFLYGRK